MVADRKAWQKEMTAGRRSGMFLRFRVALVENDAEFFAENGFDSIDIVFHENEFLLRVRKAFEEVLEGVRKAVQFYYEALFQLFKTFVHSGQDGDILRGEAFLNPFVLGVQTDCPFQRSRRRSAF